LKLVTFEVKTDIGPFMRLGTLSGDRIIDLNLAYSTYLYNEEQDTIAYKVAEVRVPPDMKEFLIGGKASQDAAKKALQYIDRFLKQKTEVVGPKGEKITHTVGKTRLLAPIPRPNSVRDFLCFEQHVAKSMGSVPPAFYSTPIWYRASSDSIFGPEEVVPWPNYCDTDKLDYELEFAIVIGKQGKNIPIDKADEYIAGYTIYNDVSCRDFTVDTWILGPTKCKIWDKSIGMGPCITTPDEIGDSHNLKMTARVNGQVWSEGNSNTMYWTFPELIAYLSREETLYPGDLIGSGTVGNGCCLELGKWIKPGDIVELEVQNIGILRNKIGEKPELIPLSRRTHP